MTTEPTESIRRRDMVLGLGLLVVLLGLLVAAVVYRSTGGGPWWSAGDEQVPSSADAPPSTKQTAPAEPTQNQPPPTTPPTPADHPVPSDTTPPEALPPPPSLNPQSPINPMHRPIHPPKNPPHPAARSSSPPAAEVPMPLAIRRLKYYEFCGFLRRLAPRRGHELAQPARPAHPTANWAHFLAPSASPGRDRPRANYAGSCPVDFPSRGGSSAAAARQFGHSPQFPTAEAHLLAFLGILTRIKLHLCGEARRPLASPTAGPCPMSWDATRMNQDQQERIPEIAIVGDLTENESELTERLLDVEPGGECTIYFDSPGGSPYCAMSLMTLLRIRGLKATGIVTGECSSAALWPFAACVRRLVTPVQRDAVSPHAMAERRERGTRRSRRMGPAFRAARKRHGHPAGRPVRRRPQNDGEVDQPRPLRLRPRACRSGAWRS